MQLNESSLRIKITKKCYICHKNKQGQKEDIWRCTKGHYPCKNCSSYNFELNQTTLPCFDCLNNCCVFESAFGCLFCRSKTSNFKLCSKHFYCNCIKSKLDQVKCIDCLNILKYFCYNCGLMKNCNTIHSIHNLCLECENLIKRNENVSKCSECLSYLRSMNQKKCSLCLNNFLRLEKYECSINKNSVCIDCSRGSFDASNTEFCFDCLNSYYTNLVDEYCLSCNKETENLVRFCVLHVFCPCIKNNPQEFKNHECSNCDLLMKYFCINCFQFKENCQNVHGNHKYCQACLEKLTINSLKCECEECKEIFNNNQHYQIEDEKQRANENNKISLVQNLTETQFYINQNDPYNYNYYTNSSYQSMASTNQMIIIKCKVHLIDCNINTECYHPICMHCLIEYIHSKFLKFYSNIRNYNHYWLKKFHTYRCPFKGCKSSQFYFPLGQLKDHFIQYFSYKTNADAQYFDDLFRIFAMYFEGYIQPISNCFKCRKQNLLLESEYYQCLYCSRFQVIDFICTYGT